MVWSSQTTISSSWPFCPCKKICLGLNPLPPIWLGNEWNQWTLLFTSILCQSKSGAKLEDLAGQLNIACSDRQQFIDTFIYRNIITDWLLGQLPWQWYHWTFNPIDICHWSGVFHSIFKNLFSGVSQVHGTPNQTWGSYTIWLKW